MSCLSYLAALGVVVDRVSRGQHEAVLRRGLLSAWSAVVTIIHTAGFAPHAPDTHHLQSKRTDRVSQDHRDLHGGFQGSPTKMEITCFNLKLINESHNDQICFVVVGGGGG